MSSRRPRPITGRRPTREELASFAGSTVDDLLADPLRLLFVGINPGLWTAAVDAHFARPGNRFWPALHRAGITGEEIDASMGLSPSAREELATAGIGISNVCPIATARADELTTEQLRAGGDALRLLVRRHRPSVVAVLGVTAFRQAFGAKGIAVGHQPDGFEGADLWVLPNPSGLNAHETVDSLAQWYRLAADSAGLDDRRQ